MLNLNLHTGAVLFVLWQAALASDRAHGASKVLAEEHASTCVLLMKQKNNVEIL